MQKKAQGGINAAILVAIIAGLIILYIIFLPASERERIVGGGKEPPSGGVGGEETPNVLLKVFPGMLSIAKGLENDKSITNIFLVETTNAKELERINPFIVRSGWFDKKDRKIDFQLNDPDNTDNVVVSFTTKKRSGILTVKLNGVVIFENELASSVAEPVKLDKKMLGKTNSLEFSVSSVGAKFWTTNEYSFENVKIIGDITDTSKQQSTNIFTLSESEFSSVDKATLKFIPYCGNVNEVGALDIFINNRKLFSTVPKCSDPYKQSVPKGYLNEGENNIIFKTNKGSYSVEQIKLSLEFKEPQLKTYFFEISPTVYKEIVKGSKNVEAALKFTEDKKKKRVKLDINGRIDAFETDKQSFTRIISNKISEGNNFIRLEPLEDIEVVELRVELK